MMRPSEYVNPNIGTIGHLLTALAPTVSLPHGMMKVAPATTPGISDRYLADRIFGFPAGCGSLLPFIDRQDGDRESYSAQYDHDWEETAPYAYKVLLEEDDITVEMTVSSQSACYRFAFPAGRAACLVVEVPADGGLVLRDSRCLLLSGTVSGAPNYSHLSFSSPLECIEQSVSQRYIRRIFRFAEDRPDIIEVRIGLSHISLKQAQSNMKRELGSSSYEDVREAAKQEWDTALGKITVDGGSDEQKTMFYTCLYRSLLNMSNITEDGSYYSGYDGQVHDSEGTDFYVKDQIWDTYRCLHPLQLLLNPQRTRDVIRSYLRMYEQCGWLPQFPFLNGDQPIMTGNHTAAMIYDAYTKGCRDFNLQQAYEAMKVNATSVTMLPWVHGSLTELDQTYLEQGFFPALAAGEQEWVKEVDDFERRQSVALTLEHAYDDWCVAQVAKQLGHDEDYQYFTRRGQNYRNLYNSKTGFMAPKTKDGNWVEDFDPKYGGGFGGRDYFSECNSWIYSFHVQHDIPGLMELMGGRQALEERLDALFAEQYDGAKYTFLGQFPDSTGLIGQYCQGNEPAFHIPYLYNYCGAPWKTQRRIREIMELWYQATPAGFCGDEDNGAMASWYVWSAIGLYPVCPGKPYYDIGSPLFAASHISLPEGKLFTIQANQVSKQNKYIQSAQLNGKELHTPRIQHSDLVAGGTLVLEMGGRPNKQWGLQAD